MNGSTQNAVKRHIWQVLAVLALTALLPLGLFLTERSLPSLYGESYYAELPEMYHRLYGAEGKKLVIVGGSNVAFGLEPALLENLLAEQGYDYAVCPFGLYAAIGTVTMLDLSLDALGEGDIVVLALEPSSETISDYFGAAAFWKCAEDCPELLWRASANRGAALAGAYIPYLQERVAIVQSKQLPKPEGVYRRDSFDETCGMGFVREGNIMPLGYDTGTSVDLDGLTISGEFIRQVSDYCTAAHRAGAQVYLSFSPVNRAALADSSSGAVQRYFDRCNAAIPCQAISDPARYILDSGWFYDNNFHLNSAGAVLRTQRLAEDLLVQLGSYSALDYAEPVMPEAIAKLPDTPKEDSSNFFTFAPVGAGYLISGLTEDGLKAQTLKAPAVYQGGAVVGFAPDALAGASALEELTLPETIESLPNGLFQECICLERLVLEHTDTQCSISENSFAGAERMRIFVPEESYINYRDGIGCGTNPWAAYLDRIYTYKRE